MRQVNKIQVRKQKPINISLINSKGLICDDWIIFYDALKSNTIFHCLLRDAQGDGKSV